MFSAFSDKIMALYQKYLRSFVEKNTIFEKDSFFTLLPPSYIRMRRMRRLISRNSNMFYRDLLDQNHFIY